MAKLKATPKNFNQALAALNGKTTVRLGNNTYLEAVELESDVNLIVVRFHNTDIVKFYANGVTELYTGGYRTVTTKERINQFINGRLYQKDGQWFIYHCLGYERQFVEGMEA